MEPKALHIKLTLNPSNLCMNKKNLNTIVKDTLEDTKIMVKHFHSEVYRFREALRGTLQEEPLTMTDTVRENIINDNGDTFPVYTRFFYKYLLNTYWQLVSQEKLETPTFTRITGKTYIDPHNDIDLIICIRKAVSFTNAHQYDKALDFTQWFQHVWSATRVFIMTEAFKPYGITEPFTNLVITYDNEYNKRKNTDKFQMCIHNNLKIMFSVLKGIWIELGTQGHSVPKFFKTLVDKYGGSSWDYELNMLNYITSSFDCDLEPEITDPPISETSSEELGSDEDPSN